MKKAISLLLCIMLLLTVLPVSGAAETVSDVNPDIGYNLGRRLRPTSYICETDDGFMTVYHDYYGGGNIIIEYFDDSFNLQRKISIKKELDFWGGFYKGADAYYIAEGSKNEDEKDDAEVIRVIKYDFDWNRLGAAKIKGNPNLFGGVVRYPFEYGCADMTEYDGILYLVTGHEGYVDPQYNQGHQGFLMAAVDEKEMTGGIIDCDLWHSFAQYIDNKDKDLYVLEQSEGSRYTKVSRYNAADFSTWAETVPVFEYGGSHTSAWAISCFATVDALALSNDNVLALGTSIDQSNYDNYSSDMPYNIYLTVTPMSNFSKNSTQVKWLTDYNGNGKRFIGANMTKVNDNCFMVSWEEYSSDENSQLSDKNDLLSSHILHYVFIDGNGNKLTDEFTVHAAFSDCQPIVKGSSIVFFASNGNMIDFYSIDTKTGKFNKRVYRNLGESSTWRFENGTLTISGTGSIELKSDVYGSSPWDALSDEVKKIVVKNGITNIPEYQFAYFENLEEVYIEQGLQSIGKGAFAFCDALKKVTIPPSVTSIGEDIVWGGYYWVHSGGHVYSAAICGEKGSYAEEYANNNGISFSEVDIPKPVDVSKLYYGNVDGDDLVTSADALLILRASVDLEDFNETQNKFADVNGDGSVDSADSLSVLRYSVGFKDSGVTIGK